MICGQTIDARVADYRRLLERKDKLIEEGRKQTAIIFNAFCDEYFAFQALRKCQSIQQEMHDIACQLAEMFILCPKLRPSFMKEFANFARKKREFHNDW